VAGQTGRVLAELRQKMAEADDRMETVNAKIIGWSKHAEHEVRGELDRIMKRIELSQASIKTARADIEQWVQSQKNETGETIAGWKERGEVGKLESRADRAERYAIAALGMVVAALDDAERASCEAWLARRDAK
jgi:hypothetical protein